MKVANIDYICWACAIFWQLCILSILKKIIKQKLLYVLLFSGIHSCFKQCLFGGKSPGRTMVANSERSEGIQRRADPSRTENAGVAGRLGVLRLNMFIHCAPVSTCVAAHWTSKDALSQTWDQTPNSVIWIWEKEKKLKGRQLYFKSIFCLKGMQLLS